MNEDKLFAHLHKQKKAMLLEYLRDAFAQMNAEQRRAVFGDALPRTKKKSVDGEELWQQIEQFRRDSLAHNYYAPFNMNSKNYRHIPEETHEWCDRFAEFVRDTSHLTAQGEHAQAVCCFAVLLELLEAMEMGREIIFAEEVGSWMIPAEEKTGPGLSAKRRLGYNQKGDRASKEIVSGMRQSG